MKKRTIVGMAVAAAAGAAGWYVTARGRKNQVEAIREQLLRMLALRRDELQALRKAAENGELAADSLSGEPVGGLEVESVRLEEGALTVCLFNGQSRVWLSNEPLERLDVYHQPWHGNARPGVLYTENLGDGWYAGYACLHWS